jgi:hypothetical protein
MSHKCDISEATRRCSVPHKLPNEQEKLVTEELLGVVFGVMNLFRVSINHHILNAALTRPVLKNVRESRLAKPAKNRSSNF